MIIDTNPEFGLELTLVIPYAYWLHQRGEFEKVIKSIRFVSLGDDDI